MLALRLRSGPWPALPLRNSAERTCSSKYLFNVPLQDFVSNSGGDAWVALQQNTPVVVGVLCHWGLKLD